MPNDALSFREIAKQIGSVHRNWPRDKVLHALFTALWRGDFQHDEGRSPLTFQFEAYSNKIPAVRGFFLGLLTYNEHWIPEEVREAILSNITPYSTNPPFPWHAFGDLEPEDYDPNWRWRFIERVRIPRAVYEKWAPRVKMPMPTEWQGSAENLKRRPGRPSDAKPLYLEEHDRRVRTGEAKTTNAAEARDLADWLRRQHPYLEFHPKAETIRKELHPRRTP